MTTFDQSLNSRAYLQRRNQKLYEEMLQLGALRPRLTLSLLIGYALALLVHAITLYFVWACLWNFGSAVVGLTSGVPIRTVGSFAVALGAFFVAWQLRPRLGRWPPMILERAQFPALYGLADKVAKELKAKPLDGIAIDPNYNFAYSKVGIQQRTVVHIGLPLCAVLNDQERIAIVAHELAHGVNGDFTRGLVLGSAYKTTVRWHNFTVTMIQPGYNMRMGILFVPVWIITSILLTLFRRLLLHESRRAEYLADTLAAEVGGTDAALSALTKVQFGQKFQAFVLYEPAGSSLRAVLKRFQEYIRVVSADPKALRDIERENSIRDAHYNFTHPPMALRQRFLQAQAKAPPRLTLDADESASLAHEIDGLIGSMSMLRKQQ